MAHHVQRSLLVKAPLAPTWVAVSSMRAVKDWHPNVADVSLLNEQDSGAGASRRVNFHDGNSVVETVVEEAPREFTSMLMSELPLIKDGVVTIRTTQKSASETEVTFSIRYGVQYGPIGWLLNLFVLKRSFRKIFGISLSGLRYHLETGNLVVDSVPVAAT